MSADADWTAVSDAAHREWVDSQKPQLIKQDGPIGPRECPITGRAFYDNMEHPDLGWIAMYGGPLDVYSIPRLDATDNELRVERYDLDADGWVEGGEPLGYFYRDQQPDHEAEVARLRAMAQEQGVRDGNEIGRLRAELQSAAKAALDATALACEKEREADALRVKANRYDWIRRNAVLDGANGEQLDSEIDAAMGEGK